MIQTEQKIPANIASEAAPELYKQIAKKFLERFPLRKITREQARRTLGLCFKVRRQQKNIVLRELVDYGLIVVVNKQEFLIHYNEIEVEDKNDE